MGTVSSKPITAAVHHHVDGFTRNLIAGVTLSAEPRANITCSLSDYDFCFYLNIIVHKQNPLDSLHIKIKCEHRTRKRIYYSRPFNLTIPGDLDLTTPADPTISNELNNSKDSSGQFIFDENCFSCMCAYSHLPMYDMQPLRCSYQVEISFYL